VTPAPEDRELVPLAPTRTVAVASALAVGAALATAGLRPSPARGVRTWTEPVAPTADDPTAAVAAEVRGLETLVAGLGAEDPDVRRATGEAVGRIARDPDPLRRLALAGALRRRGGRATVLPLCLLVGDGDLRVRTVARRAMEEEGRR
jgi:hypothetical protein